VRGDIEPIDNHHCCLQQRR